MINLCHGCVCAAARGAVSAPNQAMLDEQPTSLPVDDAFAVEEEEADRYLRCIKPGGRKKGGGGLAKVFSEKRGTGTQEGDERDRNQTDERQGDEERELEMSNRVRISFR